MNFSFEDFLKGQDNGCGSNYATNIYLKLNLHRLVDLPALGVVSPTRSNLGLLPAVEGAVGI
jgi:hypothetical protein